MPVFSRHKLLNAHVQFIYAQKDIESMKWSFNKIIKERPIYLLHISPQERKTQEGKEMDSDNSSLPLHTSHVQQPRATISRLHSLLHFFTILALLYYRVSSLFTDIHIIPWLLITATEFFISFNWVLGQAYRWRPLSRTVYPERLPEDEKLPPIDVFVCTADPKKEPTIGVMNTVLSAMCLDYPPDKLSVYLSDDAGAQITLFGMREVYSFARSWVPFCRTYGIKTICPEAYFSSDSLADEENNGDGTTKFMAHREEIKLKYKVFKQSLEKASDDESYFSSAKDRPALIEVIGCQESDEADTETAQLPLLVYVSREKRSNHPHHFKAGAVNVLLRVSAKMSNAPYVLSLDCDMYCNDPTSPKQAMCFHLDPQISPSLSFVQFPQDFHNVSKHDIYNSQLTSVFKFLWFGFDGLQGPSLSGTGFFLKRESLFRNSPEEGTHCVGLSNEFIASLHPKQKVDVIEDIQDAKNLASCTYEKDTQWGQQIGFMYHCVVEDYFTGFLLHSNRWKSVYYYPPRPAFLGSVTTNFNDCLVQGTRWQSGLLQVTFSRFCPLIYGPTKMSILQQMCYASLAFQPLTSLPYLCYAIIPQLCFFSGISLYPKATDPWFSIFSIIYISSCLQHLFEALSIGGSVKLWWYKYRSSMIKSVTAYFLGCVDIFMKWIGGKEIKFLLTNKATNEEEIELYQKDVFNFQAERIFLLPLTTIVNLNIVCLILGLRKTIIDSTYDEMFVQIVLSFVLLIMGYPIIEGMIIRKDRGRIPTSVTVLSVALVSVIVSLG